MSVEFEDWLTQQRWYAGRNRELVSATTAMAVRLRDGLELVLLQANYADGPDERYQVIVATGSGPIDEYSVVATIGIADGQTAYDALYDPTPRDTCCR